ncbi:alpha/beta hydrolase [Burkholderia stagnalis]|uniref:alpha/beta hydrolase n=1 Tax=Burkholderia stagnalis TaxID=1503054 RepID=UPI000F58BEEF|nr:alpha/beta hydrolase [Burkholderia stagnalis]RQQ73118.1 alpha/beta hydrolase [Burkholderia stagnalis]RQQ74594.1 alpha/beta hydrolase [Burkholderia stagnalis]RQQ86764.1 alpha/beta hydrolase [Burkholderia stagnalis]RQQ95494.1 alpha/beta hydrolase [Burkholderia stagnalis]
MNQKFSGDVGQVAGGDVKSNSAQTNVNVHFHGGESKAAVTKFISERQRNAIARKAFEIQEKTGTDKLMVYRRLMTVFNFERMDEMPRNVYERAIKYLEGWIRNGTLGQAPAASAQQEEKGVMPAASQPVVPSKPQGEHPVHLAGATPDRALELALPTVAEQVPVRGPAPSPLPSPSPAPVQQHKRSMWLAGAVVSAAMVIAAVLYVEAHRPDALAQTQAVEPPQHCEYGGDRYSPGSVVMQAGVRRQCVAADGGAAWQKAGATRR